MSTRTTQHSLHSNNAAIGVRSGTIIGEGILGLVLTSLIIEIIVVLGLGLGEGRT